jgi:acetyl-CoA carboxylase biotin carboxyl carrier protein
MIDLRFVKKLVAMIDASTVDSIEITSDKGMKIRISKSSNQRTIQLASPVQLPPMMQSPPAAGPGSATPPAAEAPPRVEKPKVTYLEVKSPMVGTYYSAPEPGARPYITVGDRISKGQILCIIEAMKIMNEIESEFDGVVKEILAQNSHPVEYGQVLFRVDPNG